MQNQNQILSPIIPIGQAPQQPLPSQQPRNKKPIIIVLVIVAAIAIVIGIVVIISLTKATTPPERDDTDIDDDYTSEVNELNDKEDSSRNSKTLSFYSSLPETISLSSLKTKVGNTGKILVEGETGEITFDSDEEYITFRLEHNEVSEITFVKNQGDYALFIQYTDTGVYEYYSGVGLYEVETKQEAISLYLRTKEG